MEVRFKTNDTTPVELVSWLDSARQVISEPYRGRAYDAGRFYTLQLSSSLTSFQLERAPSNTPVLIDLYVQYHTLEAGGGFAPGKDSNAIIVQASPLEDGRLQVGVVCNHKAKMVQEMYSSLLDLMRERWPESGLIKQGSLLGTSNGGPSADIGEGEGQTQTILTAEEEMKRNYVLGYTESDYANQAAYCDSVPVREARPGENGTPGEDGKDYIYKSQRTFRTWQKELRDRGLIPAN